VWLVDCVSSLAGAKVEVDKLGIDICITFFAEGVGASSGTCSSIRIKESGRTFCAGR